MPKTSRNKRTVPTDPSCKVEFPLPENLVRLRAMSRSLPLALMKAREDVMVGFRPNLNAHAITEQQWRALRSLSYQKEMSVGQLSQSSLISMPSLSRILKTLDSQGFIIRRTEERDLRTARISLTDKGYALVVSVSDQAEKRYVQIVQAFGAEKLERLHELLEDLSVCMKKLAVEQGPPSQSNDDEAL